MSDKKPNSEKSDKKEQRTERRPWLHKKQGRGPHEKKKDPEEIPILWFGPNNNFAKFLEALENMVLCEYGDVGRLIESGEYCIPEPPDVNDYDFVTDSSCLNRTTYLEQQKLYEAMGGHDQQ